LSSKLKMFHYKLVFTWLRVVVYGVTQQCKHIYIFPGDARVIVSNSVDDSHRFHSYEVVI
jgi:hypothetical protein